MRNEGGLEKMYKKVLLIDPVYNPGTIPPNIPLSRIAAGFSAHNITILNILKMLRMSITRKSVMKLRIAI